MAARNTKESPIWLEISRASLVECLIPYQVNNSIELVDLELSGQMVVQRIVSRVIDNLDRDKPDVSDFHHKYPRLKSVTAQNNVLTSSAPSRRIKLSFFAEQMAVT